jgi:hypothetical protein
MQSNNQRYYRMPSEPQKTITEIRSGDAGTIRAAAEVLSGKSKKGFILYQTFFGG